MQKQLSKHASIGIFDSGVGGISVMREIVRLMPQENIFYLGDTARVPYGNKSPKTILHYSIENTSFLVEQGIKLLVIACHTSSSHALESMQSHFPIPIIGVIQPGYENLLKTTSTSSVAVLGTQSTITSGIYQKLIKKANPNALIHPIACPLFVPLIEEGFAEHAMMELAVQEYLSCLHSVPLDAVLLACTHYPLIYSTIKKFLPPAVHLVDPSLECAETVYGYLKERGLLSSRKTPPKYQFYATDATEKFKKLAEKFLGREIPHVELKPF